MVERAGHAFDDIPALLDLAPAKEPQPRASIFDGFDDWMENREPGYKARAARKAAEKRQREQAELQALLARYGSRDAVLAWTEQERLLRASVARWSAFNDPPYQHWTRSIDGVSSIWPAAPKRVIRALSAALPLPTTISAAKGRVRPVGGAGP